MNVLVIAAHPDDEVLGCGGAMAKLANEGNKVHIAILGEGITSRYDQRTEADHNLLQTLRKVAEKAAHVLGAASISLDDLPDNRFDTLPMLEITKRIEKLVERVVPEAIYTHHAGDLNLDHAIVARATLIAARPLPETPVRDVYAYEVPSSTEWAYTQLAPAFRPNMFVDITPTLETKLRAAAVYASEMRPFPHPRSPEAIRALAMHRGAQAGVISAEAFELVRSVR